jgi:hypothetical protein
MITSDGAPVILHLKNGDRLTGEIVSETTNSVTLSTRSFGKVPVPLEEISRREPFVDNAKGTPGTNAPPSGANSGTNNPSKKSPLSPANPEAAAIGATPRFWKHDIRFGLNTRYAAKSSEEILVIEKSSYAKPPFRHLFDANLKYGRIEGVVSANSVSGSEKTEYELTKKMYLFNLAGAGYDEIRLIDAQVDVGPGLGVELMKMTNFVWKGEIGFNFQQQYRSDHTEQTSYAVRIAEIFAWRVWDKLTADAKLEFLPNLARPGQYRFKAESTLRYPVSNRLSLNLDLIDIYDTEHAHDVPPNDLQIRSTIGVTF